MSANVPTLVATKNTTIKLRIADVDLDRWKCSAQEAGQSLAEWVRYRVDSLDPFEQRFTTRADVLAAAAKAEASNPSFKPSIAIPRNPRSKKDVQTAEVANQVFRVLDKPEHDKTCQCGVCDFRRKALK